MNISGEGYKTTPRTPKIAFLLLIGALVLTGSMFIGVCFVSKWYKQGDNDSAKWHGSLRQVTSGKNMSYSHVAHNTKQTRDQFTHGSSGYNDYNRLYDQFTTLANLGDAILILEFVNEVIILLQVLCVALVMYGTKSPCLKCIAPVLVVMEMMLSIGLLVALIVMPPLTFSDNCHLVLDKPLRVCAMKGPILLLVATVVMGFTEICFLYVIFREVQVLRDATERLVPAEQSSF